MTRLPRPRERRVRTALPRHFSPCGRTHAEVRVPYIVFPSEVLDFPDTEAPEGICALDFMHLWGLMCHPGDEAAQDKLAHAIAAGNALDNIRRIKEVFDDLLVDSDLTLWLAGAPDAKTTIIASAENAAFGGTISGVILGWVIFRGQREDTRATASLGSAFRMIQEACAKGWWRGGSISNIKQNIWPTYRPVAHLWAALHIWNDMECGTDVLITPSGMYHFLMMAEWLRRAGETFKPANADAPVLDATDTWKIRPEVSAEWPPFELGCRDLGTWDLRATIKSRRK
jgi:hypothetical protein